MSKVLEGLNKQQKDAVMTTEGPLLIIAGAGTGKTTAITRRIAYLIEQKLAKPSEILALTFTEKAAGEMEERVDILVPYGYIDTWISTFHSFGNRVLQENAIDLGLSPDFKVLTRPSQILFFQQNLFAFDPSYYRPLSNPTKFIEAILQFISRCKDEDISPADYKKYVRKLKKTTPRKLGLTKKEWETEVKRQEELANVYEKYEKLKTNAGLVDFGDQITLTLRLFREKPGVLRKYQKQFKYVLVDEFQDTNWAQDELVKLLVEPKDNICVVADDDQSIYRFRGAAISNVLEFKKTYPKAKIVTLLENFRSGQPILDSAYRLIRHNDPDRLEVREKIDKKLKSVKKNPPAGGSGPPKEIYAETLSVEADAIAKKIKDLTKREKLAYKDIAILVRANAHADPFLRALNMKGIPHKFVGSSGLYAQEEVKLLISFLTAISNFDDSPNLYNLASSEIYKLPLKDAIAVMDWAKRKSKTLRYVLTKIDDLEEIELGAEAKEIIKKINSDLDSLVDLSRKEPVGRALYEFLKRTGFLSRLEQKGNVEAEIKIQNIARFFDKIREFSEIAQNESVRAFTDWLAVMRGAGDDPATSEFDPDTNAVNIMTVHSAKGLEFPVVFLVNLVSDRFPSRERRDVIAIPAELIKETLPAGDFHMQEERRLFYVGMTRAMDHLFLTWSRDIGGKRTKKVSPFVLEALDKTVSSALVEKTSALEKIHRHAGHTASASNLPQAGVKVIKLTQGAVDDYQTCAYKYRYVHVLRLPILRHHAVVYGAALHIAVAAFYRAKMAGKKMPLAALLAIFEKAWTGEGFLSQEHEERRLAQGKKILADFWRREKDKKQKPTFIEKDFRFSVGGTIVTGRFDRVDVGRKKVKIIDFKSTEGRSKEEIEKNAKESIQLRVYALAYYKNSNPPVVPDFVGIYDLDSGVVGGYKPTKKHLEKTEEEIKETAKGIKNNLQEDNFPANPKYFGRVPACYYCAYNSICPFSLVRR
ncbi:MAG: ATP-dependent DNA helicase [Candidatus Woykebacteria bacterium]